MGLFVSKSGTSPPSHGSSRTLCTTRNGPDCYGTRTKIIYRVEGRHFIRREHKTGPLHDDCC